MTKRKEKDKKERNKFIKKRNEDTINDVMGRNVRILSIGCFFICVRMKSRFLAEDVFVEFVIFEKFEF